MLFSAFLGLCPSPLGQDWLILRIPDTLGIRTTFEECCPTPLG